METPKIKQIEELEQLASQNEELKKQLFEHDNTNGKLINHWKDATTQLQSTIDENNKEIERLKGLIETLHSEAFGINPVKWWEYKRQNNL